MGISKFNKAKNVTWNIDTEGFDYHKLSELEENTRYPLFGMFVTKDTGYGEGAVLIAGNAFYNIPERYVPTVKDMMSDQETVDLINAGKCAFSYSKFMSKKFHREGYDVVFHDLEDK